MYITSHFASVQHGTHDDCKFPSFGWEIAYSNLLLKSGFFDYTWH